MSLFVQRKGKHLIPTYDSSFNNLDPEEIYEIPDIKKPITRSKKQNRALHKFFSLIADQLNELGQTFHYSGFKGNDMEMKFTGHIIKEFLWKPIQITLFDIESTTKINTHQINEILDVITLFYAQKGIPVKFPNKADQLIDQIK